MGFVNFLNYELNIWESSDLNSDNSKAAKGLREGTYTGFENQTHQVHIGNIEH
jgi:hypothetical protein